MSIVEFHIIGDLDLNDKTDLCKELVNDLSDILEPGHKNVWGSIYFHPSEHFAESDSNMKVDYYPIFVKILKYQKSSVEIMKKEALMISECISKRCNRPKDFIHIIYDLPAKGRIALGGVLWD